MVLSLHTAVATVRDYAGFVRAHFPGRAAIPEGRTLVDSHFHLGRNLYRTSGDITAVVNTFFDRNVGFQAICDYALFRDIDHVVPYDEFVDMLPYAEGIDVAFSDAYATIARRGEKRVVFTKGIEVETRLGISGPGFCRDQHEIHIAMEGFEDIKAGETYAVLNEGQRQEAYMTIAHPFTVPARRFAFLPANEAERFHLQQIAKEFPVRFEGLNGANSLWMTGTNSTARVFAEMHKIRLLYSTDAHTRPTPAPLLRTGFFDKYSLLRAQVGSAGTLVHTKDIDDLRSLTGKEILAKKYDALSEGTRYGEVSNSWVFALSVAANHFEHL